MSWFSHARKSLLAACMLALAFALHTATGSAHGTPSGEPMAMPAAGAGSSAGPRPLTMPSGAAVAETAQRLDELLRDPHGPTEIWLRARRYEGDFAITRTLALRGALGATLQGSGHGTVLAIDADDVSVDNLVVRHSGRRFTSEDAGIKLKGSRNQVRNVRVEDALFGIVAAPCPYCVIDRAHVRGPTGSADALKGDGIKLWESSHALVRSCLIEDVRDVVVWYSRHAVLDGNTVRRSRYGTHFMYAHDSEVRNSRVENDVVGIFVMYSQRLRVEHNVLAGARGPAGVGNGFKDSDGVDVANNWIVANTVGTYLDGTPRAVDQPVAFRGNTFALNEVALRFHGVSEALAFEGNDFRQNATLAEVEGGGDALSTRFARNHYSDYVGYDLDGNGVGDVPHQLKRLSADLVDAHPALAFFRGTAGMGLIDAIASAMPVFASRVLLEDREPLLVARRAP